MRTVTIDLNSNPEIKDLVADMQPGDNVTLHTSIKAKDDQTLTVTINEAEKGSDDESDDENDEPAKAGNQDNEDEEYSGAGSGY